ncbi:GIY-YIG nuclease family protein [Dolichospermum sp. ST_sed3]|nr:GIY-YIG nuclease family protein [Dolichospermum sp. ST_sed3]
METKKINNKSGVYTITNLINAKIYVGSAFNFKRRFLSHFSTLKSNKHKNNRLQNSFNKYGIENFKFEILEECNIEFVYSQECFWINMLNSCDTKYGYNIKPGNPYNKPAINKIFGEKNYFYGKKGELSPMFGKTGNKHHNFGKLQSEEWIKNNSNSKKIKIIQMSLEEIFIKEWISTKDAAESLNFSKSNITNCCRGNRKTAYNFKWKYKNENIFNNKQETNV